MRTKVTHSFVDAIPEDLEEGLLYVCMQYETVAHKCCCGCGNEVISPLHPGQWSLLFDGNGISLAPSIGNWSFPCKSHYWIRGNKVCWDRRLSDEQIVRLRTRDRELLQDHFEYPLERPQGQAQESAKLLKRVVRRFKVWLRRLLSRRR